MISLYCELNENLMIMNISYICRLQANKYKQLISPNFVLPNVKNNVDDAELAQSRV